MAMKVESTAAPVPLEHYAQSVQCLFCHSRESEKWHTFAWRPLDSDLRRNSLAIVGWVCDACAEGTAAAVGAARMKGPVNR